MQKDYMIQIQRTKTMLDEEKSLRRQREKKTKRILSEFCAADRRLEKLATAMKNPPRWRRATWVRRMNDRWAEAAGARKRLELDLLQIGGR